MDTRRNDTAGPALRGFRLQILYTLARLTEPQTALQATLWPEGIEDLAIFDHQGVLREAIQIKGHTAPLTLSELVSRGAVSGIPRPPATKGGCTPACPPLAYGTYKPTSATENAWRLVSDCRTELLGWSLVH